MPEKKLLTVLALASLASIAYATGSFEYLERVVNSASKEEVGSKEVGSKRKNSVLNGGTEDKQCFELIGSLTLREALETVASVSGLALVIDSDAKTELEKKLYLNVRARNLETLLRAIERQADVWITENPLSKTLEVRKYKWITAYPDLEGATTFSLVAGAAGGVAGGTQEDGGEGTGGEGGGGSGFSYSLRNQDAKLLLGVLSALNVPAYPFMSGFVKMKVSPSQYVAVKQIMDSLKKHSEVVIGEVKIYKVELSENDRLGINWRAILKDFRVGSITQAEVSVNLTPFTTSDTPVSVALLNGEGQEQALLQVLSRFGDVKMVNTWLFEGKTGTIIPFGSYKEEPYVTYTVVEGEQTTQVVPQVEYKYAGFMGNVFVAKQKERYYVELALNLSDVYGYFTLSTSQFTQQIPKVQSNQLRIATYLPRLNTTLLLTGFKLKSFNNQEQKVPFLGDLPLIGNLFKSTDKTTTTSEFVILVSLYKFGEDFLSGSDRDGLKKSIFETKRKIEEFENPPPKEVPFEVMISF